MAGIYIHIPFCASRCAYCDFYSTTQLPQREAYIEAVCHELEYRRGYLDNEPVETVYLGGGTPSLLNWKELRHLFDTIQQIYGMEHVKEVTIEANPDDLTDEYVSMLRTLPINRISIGIQSFNDATLRLINRRHTATEAIAAVRRCQQQGLSNISIDLIYGLPGEDMEAWDYSLQQAIGLQVTHISAYHLTYEVGTRLWHMKETGQIHPITEEQSVKAFELLRKRLLGAGFEHYEISNFSLPGYRSQHNSSYWKGTRYLGIGPGAHSFDGRSRRWNLTQLNQYIEGSKCHNIPYEDEHMTLNERYDERIITELRTCEGIRLPNLQKDFGEDHLRYCLRIAQPYIQSGQLVQTTDKCLHLTPQSIFISDAIMRDLLWDE